MLDLELLHNFCTSTYATMSDDPFIRDMWRVRVVKLSFSCDYVMFALLSISALHLARFSPERGELLREKAISSYNRASGIAAEMMVDVSQEKSHGLFAFSILTVYFGKYRPIKAR